MRIRLTSAALAAALAALAASTGAQDRPAGSQDRSAGTQDKVLNLYSARHYQTDEKLYTDFTRATGIRVNRIESGDEALLERLRAEGNASPADVLLLVDAARLWRAQIDGLFQPVQSRLLESRIPAHLRGHGDAESAGAPWYGFSTRARMVVYNKDTVRPQQVATYQALAAPELKGKVCTRSGSHPYMLSWIGAMSEHLGRAQAEDWARGVVANFARTPRGGDTDQIKAVASGECGVAVTNTYYLARLMRSDKPEDRAVVDKLGWVMPNQAGFGTHVNISGGGVLKNAPNREAAVKFLEYLASDQAQRYLADGNNEWPVVASIRVDNPALEKLAPFKADTLSVAQIGRAQIDAQRIVDRVGWR